MTELLIPRRTPIGWDGQTLKAMLEDSEQRFADTGRYHGLDRLTLKEDDPIGYEKLFARVRGGLVSARETALNISASPIVRELGELAFALYTPEGDSVALSTGIIVHVHTMSQAIKFMVRNGWEDNPKIRPGDIFANNQPQIGDVHNADVQTFVPIFDPTSEEPVLLGWAGGVCHVVDIGAATPGGAPVGPTTRYEDGIDLCCMKIGEEDQIASWHWKRCELMSRSPRSYILDERTRLAGCHMIRDAIERLVVEEGAERFKGFMREAIEDGRRSFKSKVRTVTVPGRYRSPGFLDVTFADKETLPARARRDFMMHGAFESIIGGDGHYTASFDGSSAWGWHSMNATPAAITGLMWIQFTQTLIFDERVNDGAHFATTVVAPPGTWANLDTAECSTSGAWGVLFPSYSGYPRSLSRAQQSRGFIEEVMGSFSSPGNVMQGGGIDQYGQMSGFMHFEVGAQGQGAKYCLDGLDYGAAPFNPEGDMGDAEMWELMAPILYLGRRIKPNTGGLGRHRGGSSFESLMMVWGSENYELQNILTGGVFSSPGLFGGYPAATSYVHTIYGPDTLEQAREGGTYPIRDGSYDAPELEQVTTGVREQRQDALTTLKAVRTGDLYLSVLKGAGGLGDPLERPVEAVQADIEGNHLLARFAQDVYAVDDRETARRRRLDTAEPTADWWARARKRILDQDIIEAVSVMYAESMKLSPRWAAEFRGFWDLPEDFAFDTPTPTVAAAAPEPGRVTPEQSVAEYLASATAFRPEWDPEPPASDAVAPELLADLLDERLSRDQVRSLQSSFKDPGR
ncbi:MAG: hydantoinase B/oxoprolinase family protein, partial [Solirubrobacteraceae bacterium]